MKMTNDLKLSLAFAEAHTLDAARILERERTEEITSFLLKAPVSLAASLIKLMDTPTSEKCLKKMDPPRSAAILCELFLEMATLFLRQIHESLREAILRELPPEILAPLHLVLSYPEESAGTLMDPLAFTLPEDIVVEDAVRRVQERLEQVNDYIYVVDREHVLVGLTSIRELLLSDPQATVAIVMRTDFERLDAHLDRKAILDHPGWQEFHELAVVDEKDIFLGAIGYRTLRRLEGDGGRGRRADPAATTGAALGELYWLGLSGVIKGAAAAVSGEEK